MLKRTLLFGLLVLLLLPACTGGVAEPSPQQAEQQPTAAEAIPAEAEASADLTVYRSPT